MDDSLLYERRARICQVLADPKRLRLMDALRDDAEKTVGELAAVLGASYPSGRHFARPNSRRSRSVKAMKMRAELMRATGV